MERVQTAAAICVIAIIFFTAGISKLLNPRAFALFLRQQFSVSGHGSLSVSRALAIAEVLIALGMLLKWSIAIFASMMFFSLFTAASMFLLLRHTPPVKCGCFGSNQAISPAILLLRNFGFLLVCTSLIEQSGRQLIFATGMAVIFAAIFLPSARPHTRQPRRLAPESAPH